MPLPLVFISYARKDAALVEEFRAFLDQYKKHFEYFIDTRDISAGERFDEVIGDALDRAVFAALMISVHFANSDYIQDIELPRIERCGIATPWALLGPCDLGEITGVQGVNALHDPNPTIDGPMSLLPPEQRAVRWQAMAAKIRDKAKAVAPKQGKGQLGELHGVPSPPPRYVPRVDELDRLREAILANSAVGITGMKGAGGVGKTVLASSIVAGDEVRARFPDGIFWITAGQNADPARLLQQLAKMIGADTGFANEFHGNEVVKRALDGKRVLVVADDVWEPGLAQNLNVTTGDSRLLITTRIDQVITRVGGQPLDIGDRKSVV